MVKSSGSKGHHSGSSLKEHPERVRKDDLEVREGDQVLLIGPRNSHPTICSTAEINRATNGEGAAGLAKGERLKSSLRWQGSLNDRETRRPEGWRLSHSSVSSIYYSAQDISELMSVDNLSDWSSDQLSSFRSYHSVRDSLLFDKDLESDDKDDDVFNSPQESPTCSGAPIQQTTKKVVKSVVFVEAMAPREVDFVLVWDAKNDASRTEDAKERRKHFEKNLEEEGLMLEREKIEGTDYNFVKIHAPMEVLRRYAEILKLRMPMKQVHGDVLDSIYAANEEFNYQQFPHLNELKNRGSALVSEVKSWFSILTDYFRVDPRMFPQKDQKMTAVYTREKEYLFDVNEEEFFTPAVRARIIDFILRRKRYTDNDLDDFAFGIERLLTAGVYFAAYPLHDGDLKTPGSQRYLLYTEWAALSKGLKYQPLDAVKEYFGVKIGLYFAWLGFYTHMLIPASILGALCFLYGCLTLYDNRQSEDICESVNVTMCPLCDKLCDYWELRETCFYARLTYLFDNDATVFFAIVMSLWSAVFLECWKRYSAEITHKWDLTGFDVNEEHPRPEYLIRLKHVKRKETNIITNVAEPYVPFWRMKLPYTLFSVSMVLFLISLAVAAVVAVVFYRVSFMLSLMQKSSELGVHSWGLLVVNTTAASINLVFIFFFNWLYSYLAEYLTELELHRTQTQFDDSVTLKMYLLQFVNYYASIFYIAFFKGKFVGYPAKYTRFFGKFRQEECAPGGCMSELCIQLATIMVGKQAMNTVLEMLWPLAMKSYQKFTLMTGISKEDKGESFSAQWMKDAKLLEWGPRSLFPEYLEMVLQYGFITIFVAAFPLAPLFALLNNILEMRLDAKKLLVYYRRPVTQRVKDIGVWYTILDSISKIAVISNAFIIAFTSNFIPKMVYRYGLYKNDHENPRYGTLQGFLNYSLATFNTSDLDEMSKPDSKFEDPGVCRYQTFRYSHDHPDPEQKYKRTDFYWKVWMARLAFVVVFENVVALCVMFLRWLIPDIPRKLEDTIRREMYLTNEIIIKQEMLRARGVAGGDGTAWNPISGEKELELVRCTSSSNSLRKRNTKQDALEERNRQTAEVMV
ncbi:unnamed protein product [Orchesella dallaii]|uniref:Anoctamin n=1 Tax=Orchesella dallaii TaxID=48710 RepID=A0ABP1Q1B6_9HEXA